MSLLSTLYLASPSLPIGAFAYSQGLESAIENEWVGDDVSLKEWMHGILHAGISQLELPVLWRCMDALQAKQFNRLEELNHITYSNRETRELLFEEEQLGQALLRLMRSLEKVDSNEVPAKPSFLVMFAIAANALGISPEDSVIAFIWSWMENQVAVACKAIPLGQTAAQKVLMALMPEVEKVIQASKSVEEENIGATLPGLVMGSAFHETQYSRLFRS